MFLDFRLFLHSKTYNRSNWSIAGYRLLS